MDNQWGYDDVSQVADPNVAIPMPYVGPMLPGQNRSTVPDSYDVPRNEGATQTGDIPMAPTSQADAIGPPNQNNTHK
jgi:molecular chaperone GrpE (heat shock protein)